MSNNSLFSLEYPDASASEVSAYSAFIADRCSDYFFLDYLRDSRGDVSDAIQFYEFDSSLIALLMKCLLSFEIRAKDKFSRVVAASTGNDNFWRDPSFYLPSFTQQTPGYSNSQFSRMTNEILEDVARLRISRPVIPSDVVFYACSFGCFLKMVNNIVPQYKTPFLVEYSSKLTTTIPSYRIVYQFLYCLKVVRNRCAHGNHVVSQKLLSDLGGRASLISSVKTPSERSPNTILEATLSYLFAFLPDYSRYLDELKILLTRYQPLCRKYPVTQPIRGDMVNNFFE